MGPLTMKALRSLRPRSLRPAVLREESGFTLIEVMVAATVLVVGLLGTVSMIDEANSTSWSTKAREQAVGLQRDVIESARSIPYDELTPSGTAARLQQESGLEDASTAPGWTIRRRGFTYSISVGACAVDDPRDGTGTHDGGIFCASGSGATSGPECSTLLGTSGAIQGAGAAATAGASVGDCGIDLNLDGAVDNLTEASIGVCLGICPGAGTDQTPSDYKRIVVLVRWDRGKGTRYALQATTVPNPGLAAAPIVTDLSTSAPSPVTNGTSVDVVATTSRAPATVGWYVDGTHKGAASGSGTTWTFSWPLGIVSAGPAPNPNEVLDGSYLLGAKAFDAYGQFGSTRSLTITLNRRSPYPVTGFFGGRNGSVVEFEWSSSKERDIRGYRIYRLPAVGAPIEVCTLTVQTTCQDKNPPAMATLEYVARAVDKDTTGALREGASSVPIIVTQLNHPPNPPTGLVASSSGGNTILLWKAPTIADPDLGDQIAFYRIYRDGATYADRYDRTANGTQVTFTDTRTGGQQHQYRVTAVDTQLAESTILGPVTR